MARKQNEWILIYQLKNKIKEKRLEIDIIKKPQSNKVWYKYSKFKEIINIKNLIMTSHHDKVKFKKDDTK